MTQTIKLLIAATMLLGALLSTAHAETYDLVILNGRVIDPETELDETRNVGITDGSIVDISEGPLEGRTIVDAAGKVVAPGFIDIHSHSPTQLGSHFQLLDGVTTQLDLDAGAF